MSLCARQMSLNIMSVVLTITDLEIFIFISFISKLLLYYTPVPSDLNKIKHAFLQDQLERNIEMFKMKIFESVL